MSELPYRRLLAWQRAHALAHEVLDLAESEPFARRPWFRDQVARAALSVSANIAEGSGRHSRREFASHVAIARGSLFELDSALLLARERGWLEHERGRELQSAIQELSAILSGLGQSLRDS
ncbi:four helix bundle protein [Tepidiforma flava]|uniref:Four helix bundle protein n=1 Tax=Tepidiforma flava TaxID=3004094 RepID=A0ABY7M438_9CHLR|nr:four helix bundle protein [Tepidiforma flava]WBL34753.1 four helix bundle protein [Tepidiforma flava]